MFSVNVYKKLFAACVVAMVAGLAMEAALSLGYVFEKWSANSLTLAVGLLVGLGLTMVVALYLAGCILAAKYQEANQCLGC